MRKRYCPQCSIANLYVKNHAGEQRTVFVAADGTVISTKEEESLEGFNLEIVYCLGCSWSGSPAKLDRIPK